MTDGNASAWSVRRIEEEVRRLAREISFKYVPNPSMDGVESDVLIGLKRFRHAVRNRARFVDSKKSTTDAEDDDDSTNNPTKDDGLGTNLRPTGGCGPDDNLPAAREVEAFLYDIEKDLLGRVSDMKKKDTREVNNTTKRINNIFSKLRQRKDIVVAMTDKTNSVRVLLTTKYIELVEDHLRKDATETTLEHLQEVHSKAYELLESIKNILDENEFKYIKSTITKRAIPTVQLLIKDHKKVNETTGDYPSRLVVPAKNFTAGFPHVGQRGITALLKKNKVNYERKTIKHASNMKEDLEKLKVKRSENSIVTLDIEAMYPSVQFIQVERAVEFFLQDES